MNALTQSPQANASLSSRAQSQHRQKMRALKEKLAHHLVGIGGISVIIAIVLIFIYLLYVVFPMFLPADMESVNSYQAPGEGNSLYLAVEEQNEIGLRISNSGEAIFFLVADGALHHSEKLPLPEERKIHSLTEVDPIKGILAFGLDDGEVLLAQHKYRISYPNDKRQIDPYLAYPFGEQPISVNPQQGTIEQLAVGSSEESITFLSYSDAGMLYLSHFDKVEDMLGEGVTLEEPNYALLEYDDTPSLMRVDPEQHFAYVANQGGMLRIFDLNDPSQPELIQTAHLTGNGTQLTRLDLLLGGISLLVGDSSGHVSQWFMSRNEQGNQQLHQVRQFDAIPGAVSAIKAEQRRKGFVVATDKGEVGIYHSTANRQVTTAQVSDQPIQQLALSPRANGLLALDASGKIHAWHIDNEHPEISWSALWGEVWYENYDKPEYIWQSSAATNDFEPKFSLVPLTFGTIKAAFYAMLMAMPLAILGAIYTAYFMAPAMRKVVKPTIEIMEALPTVILGFLAGLWLAPFTEANLPGIFTLLLLVPIGMLVFAYAWGHWIPKKVQIMIPDGWQAALLIPVVLLIGWFSLALSTPLEELLFDGNMRSWMQSQLGIGYDQRNALIVGLAMGFAVIPTIFSIAEDAIFSVPKHLTFGSLALGATPWQTLTRVVLLTASPGIFSAVMIGLGRAVGETMIVLMATGNTPVMDFSVFEGMRTLSANIAVEMPESEVDSSHYRILFLAALVLFLVTFIFNSVAELVRQRLREKYSNL